MLKDQLNALDYRLEKLPDSKHRSCVLERLRIIRRQKLIRQLRAKIDRYALQLTGALPSRSPIMAIEYWEGADVTVAVLNERDWKEARQVYDSLGLLYTGYEFKPHVTLARVTSATKWKSMNGWLVITCR